MKQEALGQMVCLGNMVKIRRIAPMFETRVLHLTDRFGSAVEPVHPVRITQARKSACTTGRSLSNGALRLPLLSELSRLYDTIYIYIYIYTYIYVYIHEKGNG